MLYDFIQDEEGATALEYGLIASLVAVAVIAGLTMLGEKLSLTFEEVAMRVGSEGNLAGGQGQP